MQKEMKKESYQGVKSQMKYIQRHVSVHHLD